MSVIPFGDPDRVAARGGDLPQRAVLLAGGRGTRLGELARGRPKPLLPVQGVPVIERLVAQLRAAGVVHCMVVTCHLAEVVEAHLGDGRDLGVRIDYLREQEPLGTAGCLGLLERPEHAFYLLNTDILTDLSFRQLAARHVQTAAAATVAVWRHTTTVDYGVVDFDASGRVTGFREKPVHESFVAMGIACLTPAVCGHVRAGEAITLPELLARLVSVGETVSSYRHDGGWCDIGRPDDYERAQRMLLPTVASPARRRAA
jgi:NDP-sugar pyrophosphorylase family protein